MRFCSTQAEGISLKRTSHGNDGAIFKTASLCIFDASGAPRHVNDAWMTTSTCRISAIERKPCH